MTTTRIVFAAALAAGTLAGIAAASAHSVEACQREIRTYAKVCKLSPTAWILGACDTTKTYKWCSDKKLHQEKFHKN
ncbi:MAG: hypothetical protein AB7U38_13855 [Hyphomicrobiales bacterium]